MTTAKIPDRPRTAARARLPAALLLAAVAALPGPVRAQDAGAWTVVGRQGLVQHVVGPVEAAADEAAYERQIALLCKPEQTCFLNFYTNSTQAPVEFPLPEAIAREATATYRRSMKNGVQVFTWSCRLKRPEQACF